jgi:hypothetical protein
MEETFNLFYKFDKILDKMKKPVYLTSIGFIYISYFLIFFGIFYINKKYIELFSNLLLIFVCLFLIRIFTQRSILYLRSTTIPKFGRDRL